jgi:hypothetical protein
MLAGHLELWTVFVLFKPEAGGVDAASFRRIGLLK